LCAVIFARVLCWCGCLCTGVNYGANLKGVKGVLKRNFIAVIILPLHIFWLFVKILLQSKNSLDCVILLPYLY